MSFNTLAQDPAFIMFCRKAEVDPTERQAHKFVRGDGAAATFAIRTGNANRIKRLAKRHGVR